jgi:hypothetical protein
VPFALEDVEIPIRIDGNRSGVDQWLLERRLSVRRHTLLTIARDGLDDAAREVDDSHAAITEIAEIQKRTMEGDREDSAELRLRSRTTVAGESFHAGPRDSSNDTGRQIDCPNAEVLRIGHVQAPVRTKRKMMRVVERRLARRAAVP